MNPFDRETLMALGLGEQASLRPVESASWDDPEMGHGFVAAEPVDYFARQENILTEQLPLPAFEQATGGQVRRHRETGGIAYLHVPGARLMSRGRTAASGAHAIVMDARSEPVAVRIDLEWFTYLLLLRGNQVEVVGLEQVAAVFADRPAVAAAGPEMLFGDLAVEEWLRSEVAAHAALPSSWARAIAAGLAARLWCPPRGARPDIERLRKRGSPASRAVAWFAGLAPPDREFLEHAALQHAESLFAGLEAATEEAERDAPGASESIHALLMRRDDAECVCALLASDARSAVSAALGRVDRAAVTHLSSLSAHSFPDDERLRAVLRSEPEAWWGRFAEP